jgi:hypothetical protein
MSGATIAADIGYCHRCRRSAIGYCRYQLLLPMSAVIAVAIIADANAPRALLLHSEIDAAGHANALETPLLLSSDVIAADVEFDQRPVIRMGHPGRDNDGTTTSKVLVAEVCLGHSQLKGCWLRRNPVVAIMNFAVTTKDEL